MNIVYVFFVPVKIWCTSRCLTIIFFLSLDSLHAICVSRSQITCLTNLDLRTRMRMTTKATGLENMEPRTSLTALAPQELSAIPLATTTPWTLTAKTKMASMKKHGMQQ